MLKTMRKNMKIVMWILLVTFVLWGGSSAVMSRSKTAKFPGSAFGKNISWKEYEQNYNAVENQIKLMYGEKFNQVKQYLNLDQQAWNRIVLLKEASSKHISASDSEVLQTICNMPLFQDSSRKFVPQIYKRVIDYFLRIQAREFEDQVKDSIRIEKLRDKIVKDVTISDEEIKNEYKLKNDKVNADYAVISASAFIAQAQPTADEASKYYQAHSMEFITPLRINIEYIQFDYGTDKKLQEKADEASTDVSYELAQNQHPDFYGIAKKFGYAVKESGFFAMGEPIPSIGMSNDIATEAFKLKPGEISPPIKGPNGRYIIRFKGKKEPYIPALAEVEQKIKNIVAMEDAAKLAAKKAEETLTAIKQKLGAGMTFKQTCAELGLEVKSTGLFSKAGYIPEIGTSQEFANTAFSQDAGSPSGEAAGKLAGTAKIPQGTAIIFVTEKVNADEEKFKKEKDQFKLEALQAKQEKYFEQYFKKLLEKANVKVIASLTEKRETSTQQNTSTPMPLDDY